MKKDTVVIDIDGVLADYRTGLLNWIIANKHGDLNRNAFELENEYSVWVDERSMNISYREWLEVLEEFRMTRGKVGIPTFPYASQLCKYLKEKGYVIYLLTSRPIDIYSNIYIDTKEWLQKNDIPYDNLFWCRHKAEMVFRNGLIDRTAFAIDDEYKHIEHYSKLGIKTFWLDHFKTESPCIDRCLRVKDLMDILTDQGYDPIRFGGGTHAET